MKGVSNFRQWARAMLFLACASLTAAVGLPASQQRAPDNTKSNSRDRQPSAATAGSQKNNKSDLETTRQIRKALMADKSLSTYARNVKVITQNGKVTLKGPVRSEEEKKAAEVKAVEVAGARNVTNQISVAPGKADSSARTTKRKHKTNPSR